MKYYEDFLNNKGKEVVYIEAKESRTRIETLARNLAEEKIEEINVIDPTDYLLMRRLKRYTKKHDIKLNVSDNLLFINSLEDLEAFFKTSKKKFFQTSFYKTEREKRNLLMDSLGKPSGGKWTYDDENRKKYPKNKQPPNIEFPKMGSIDTEAYEYVEREFSGNIGELERQPIFPSSHKEADKWLDRFLSERFSEFGTYEDAIVEKETFLNHSVLSPAMNVGLIRPMDVLSKALSWADEKGIAINNTEGFLRQILGWREFIRGVYEVKGVEERTRNFWGFERKMPQSFYDGTTGIVPVDVTIKKILKTGYCHHIERLMILGNFMMLCHYYLRNIILIFLKIKISGR